MAGPDELVLVPKDPAKPVVSPAGHLLQPVSIKGYPVRLRPPTEDAVKAGRGYIWVSYYELGRRKNTSGGMTLEEALVTAREIIDVLSSGAADAPRTMGALVDEYLDPNRPMKSPWSAKHRYSQERLAKLYIKPLLGRVRCRDLTRDHVQRAINTAPTEGEGKRVRVLLGSIIKYGIQLGYLTQTLERLHGGAHWTAPPASKDKSTANGAGSAGKSGKQQGKATAGAKANTKSRADAGAGVLSRKVTVGRPDPQVQEQGTSALAVSEDDYPTLDEIYDLAVQFGALENAEDWWPMMPIFVAFTGLRIGEFIGLSADNVSLDPRNEVRVTRQYLDLKGEFTAPKRNKTRRTSYPDVTPPGRHYPEGFPLGEWVKRRKEAVGKRLAQWPSDKGRPTERDGLLFPAKRGGPWTQSNLSRRVLRPAAEKAGWAFYEDTDQLVWAWHSLRHFFGSYHVREVGTPLPIVSNVMGHAKTSLTIDLYVKSGADDYQRLYPDG